MKLTVGILGLVIAVAGCNSTKSASTEESAAVSKIIGPMLSESEKSTPTASFSQNLRAVRAVNNYLASVGPLDDADPCSTIDSAFTDVADDMKCTKNKCQLVTGSSFVADITCTSAKSYKETCDNVDYTMKNLTMTVNVDFHNSSSKVVGSATIAFILNLTGGALTGTGDLTCAVAIDASQASEDITADNLSCKYDGKKIDPNQLKEQYGSTSTCTETEITTN